MDLIVVFGKMVESMIENAARVLGHHVFRVTTFLLLMLLSDQLTCGVQTPESPLAGPPQWKAAWVWADEGADYGRCYFRLSFDLAESPAQAVYQGMGSEQYWLYVNGRQLLHRATDFNGADVLNIAEHLHEGKNVLAVHCLAEDYFGGWLGQLTLVASDGRTTDMVTDEKTLSCREPDSGWDKLDFDDTAWRPCRKIATPPRGSWEAVPFQYVGPRWQLQLDEVELSGTFRPGGQICLKADITPLAECPKPVAAYIKLLRQGQVLKTVSLAPTVATSKWTIGGSRRHEWNLPLSSYLPVGDYQVEAGFYRATFTTCGTVLTKPLRLDGPQRRPKSTPAQVVCQDGRVRLLIDGQSVPPVGFLHRPWSVVDDRHLEQYRTLQQAGVVFFNTALPIWGMTTGGGMTAPIKWNGPGRYDFSRLDTAILRILDVAPQAYFVPRTPIHAPNWWCKEHPDELCRFADGVGYKPDAYGGTRRESFASLVWRQEAGDMLHALIRHIRNATYADRVIGYHIDAGIYGEWHLWNPHHFPDVSDPMRRRFIAWAQEKYPTIDRVNQAWGTNLDSFTAIRCPTGPERMQTDHGIFRDLSRSSFVTDYYRALHENTAEAIIHFSRIVKEETAGKALCGVFYGYLPDNAWAQEGGHLAVEKVLQAPEVDFLASPHSYGFRGMGQPAYFRAYPQSVRSHGKLFIDEADVRTHLEPYDSLRAAQNVTGSKMLLRRLVANALAQDAGFWLFDMSLERSWYDDPELVTEIDQLLELYHRCRAKKRILPTQVAVVCDPWTFTATAHWKSHADKLQYALLHEQFVSLYQMGAPFDLYLLEDVLAGRTPSDQYQCWIFLNTWHLTQPQIVTLNHLRSSAACLLFLYAPGFSSDQGLSEEGIISLTDLPVTISSHQATLEARHIGLASGSNQTYGLKEVQSPRFQMIHLPAEAKTLARYCQDQAIAAAQSTIDGCTVIYSAAAPASLPLLHHALATAGVHRYLETPDNLYVGPGVLGLHFAQSGPKVVHLPRNCRVTDAATGKLIETAATYLSFSATVGTTRIFEISESASDN